VKEIYVDRDTSAWSNAMSLAHDARAASGTELGSRLINILQFLDSQL
jgi:hypothetical protein